MKWKRRGEGEESGGWYIEFLEFVEARDGNGDEIWVLRGHCDGIFSPIYVSIDAAISGDVFCEIDAMCE